MLPYRATIKNSTNIQIGRHPNLLYALLWCVFYLKYMYNQDSVIEKKVEFLKNQLETIQNDFRTNLKTNAN